MASEGLINDIRNNVSGEWSFLGRAGFMNIENANEI
jgi:hypothetical protein